ncbi:hypothetical protein FisN_10Lh209 [Fistulifera solaris]|uniref:Uncharacterized protein n=1 Tax=Fistulifera solaris TaxID=1519565 RepID=A0A1Z5JU02_FISSO|nr:hypothetical protein FisN_10Lh209 [Fistulifera solaris]|eukprot:GAX17342.1 hypothetical protein FisN_10Lh209 [Fistulifera solaris]
MTITNLNNYATTNTRKCNGPSPRVGIRPKEVIRISFEEASPAASISESVSVEEEKRDDEKANCGQRRKGSRESRQGSVKETSVTQKHNKLEAFIVNSGILQNEKKEVVSEVTSPPGSNASESNIVLAPADEREHTHSVDERQPENKPTETLLLENDSIRASFSDEKANLGQDEQLHGTENSQQQPASNPHCNDIQIEEQPSVDSICSVTEKWKQLMDGEGYVPTELPLKFLGQQSSEGFRSLFDSVTKSPLGDYSKRPSEPTAPLVDTIIAAEDDVHLEQNTSNDHARQLDELVHRERDYHDMPKQAPPTEASLRQLDELVRQATDHDSSPQQEPSIEPTMREVIEGAMAKFIEYADKLFSSSTTMSTKDDDSRYSKVSQMSRIRSSKSKSKRKSRKGPKRVRFDDEAERTPFYERWIHMCY